MLIRIPPDKRRSLNVAVPSYREDDLSGLSEPLQTSLKDGNANYRRYRGQDS